MSKLVGAVSNKELITKLKDTKYIKKQDQFIKYQSLSIMYRNLYTNKENLIEIMALRNSVGNYFKQFTYI